MPAFVLAIDQGTTGTTVALVDQRGVQRAWVNIEFPQIYPQPGWVEHSLEDIWASVRKGLRALLRRGVCKPADIAAIGITNQRETTALWRRDTGQPLANAIVWQCRRTADFCESLRRRGVKGGAAGREPGSQGLDAGRLEAGGLEAMVRRKTGLLLDPYFSASKFRWLLRNVAGARGLARRGRVLGGTIDSYLVWKLSGGAAHITDVSNAARTSLMSLRGARWDPELLDLFEVPADILPRIVPSSGVLAHTRGVPGLPDGIPISGMAGDQQAALFGQACFGAGDAKCTFGTGSFILMNTGAGPVPSAAGLLATVAWQLPGQKLIYALEGGAFICGAAVQWLRDGLGIIKRAQDVEALAAQVPDHGGVEFVPALTGLGAPWWDPHARGTITGLTRGAHRGHIARATLDAMALQNADILLAMERDLGRALDRPARGGAKGGGSLGLPKRRSALRVDGGAASNDLLMQIQANVLGRKLVRPAQTETTVAGASYLAGIGVGLWGGTGDIRKLWRAERTFDVRMTPAARRQRLQSWHDAVRRVLG